jgi:hypothetical protein
MEFTISEAAKLYGKQRKQLYRHIESGKLSCRFRGDCKRVLDLSELIRCYGESSKPIPRNDTELTRSGPAGDTALWQAMLDELKALRQEVSELKQQLALPAPEKQSETLDKNVDDPHGFRAMVDALRK